MSMEKQAERDVTGKLEVGLGKEEGRMQEMK